MLQHPRNYHPNPPLNRRILQYPLPFFSRNIWVREQGQIFFWLWCGRILEGFQWKKLHDFSGLRSKNDTCHPSQLRYKLRKPIEFLYPPALRIFPVFSCTQLVPGMGRSAFGGGVSRPKIFGSQDSTTYLGIHVISLTYFFAPSLMIPLFDVVIPSYKIELLHSLRLQSIFC